MRERNKKKIFFLNIKKKTNKMLVPNSIDLNGVKNKTKQNNRKILPRKMKEEK